MHGREEGIQGCGRFFDKLSAAANSLSQVCKTLTEIRLWMLSIQDYLGNVDPDCAEWLASAFPHLVPEERLCCTRRLLAEYEWICSASCEKASISCLSRKGEVFKHLLDE